MDRCEICSQAIEWALLYEGVLCDSCLAIRNHYLAEVQEETKRFGEILQKMQELVF